MAENLKLPWLCSVAASFCMERAARLQNGQRHAVFIGDDDTGVDGFRVLEDLDQEIGLRFGIVRIE